MLAARRTIQGIEARRLQRGAAHDSATGSEHGADSSRQDTLDRLATVQVRLHGSGPGYGPVNAWKCVHSVHRAAERVKQALVRLTNLRFAE
jgi:hypothetical protein